MKRLIALLTLVEDAGGRIALSGSEGQPTNIAQSVMLAGEPYVDENRDVVERFRSTIDEVMASLDDDPTPAHGSSDTSPERLGQAWRPIQCCWMPSSGPRYIDAGIAPVGRPASTHLPRADSLARIP